MDSERQQLLCQLCLRQLKSEQGNCLAWPLNFQIEAVCLSDHLCVRASVDLVLAHFQLVRRDFPSVAKDIGDM